MQKTTSTFIKASLVTVGVMGVITLNAWWCNYCQMEHAGKVCPAMGEVRDTDPTTFPLVGRTPDGTSVHGPMDETYRTPTNRIVQEIAGQWVYLTIVPGIFIGEANKALDSNGEPIQQAGLLADDRIIYKSEQVKEHLFQEYFVIDYIPGELYTSLRSVKLLHDRFVYNGYKCYCTENYEDSAYFDGKQWVDEGTGKVYNGPEEMPERYAPDNLLDW
ncbi:MAG: hypothetical protein LBD69_00240 [Puniceicoccales bacterium]|jgi:hypothetical protein|nr:hypothetical protein [Puniceicoccales bacterium]